MSINIVDLLSRLGQKGILTIFKYDDDPEFQSINSVDDVIPFFKEDEDDFTYFFADNIFRVDIRNDSNDYIYYLVGFSQDELISLERYYCPDISE